MNEINSDSVSFRAKNPHLYPTAANSAPRADAVTDESELHDQIEAECRLRQWPYLHSRMDMPTTTNVGAPDFVIGLPTTPPRTLWIECKTKTGKLTPQQTGFKVLIENARHEYYLVRSFAEFQEKVNKV